MRMTDDERDALLARSTVRRTSGAGRAILQRVREAGLRADGPHESSARTTPSSTSPRFAGCQRPSKRSLRHCSNRFAEGGGLAGPIGFRLQHVHALSIQVVILITQFTKKSGGARTGRPEPASRPARRAGRESLGLSRSATRLVRWRGGGASALAAAGGLAASLPAGASVPRCRGAIVVADGAAATGVVEFSSVSERAGRRHTSSHKWVRVGAVGRRAVWLSAVSDQPRPPEDR
jgi:hypothetical protein